MTPAVLNAMKAVALVLLSLVIGALGVYVGEVDGAPGAGGIGLLLMVAGVVLAMRTARNRLSKGTVRTALAVGILVAVFAAFLAHGVAAREARAPLFPAAAAVPSTAGPAPPAAYAEAIERARGAVRAAVIEQNLPGVSVAVAAGGALVWAEGFGWRDVQTRTPVTPATRFNIGTASPAILPAAASLGLANTGAEPVRPWSPEDIGGDGEDFPPLTLLRRHILQPLGLMDLEYPLPGERATFYVPRFEEGTPARRGRRLMYVFDLACCADGQVSYSTPSDLARVGLAATPGNVTGALAGGAVMSLLSGDGSGVVVAVTSNIAEADTAAIAQRLRDAFAEPAR